VCFRLAGTLYILPGTHLAPPGGGALPPPPRSPPADVGCAIVTVAAGDAVVLSDAVLHCSGRNLSGAPRRAWMPQLSAQPMLREDGRPVALAVPLAPPPPRRKRARA
jgi:ectoine hydroxylase-related dioxygenase (phytanoyl-CoA dioxygenase family)